MDREEPASDQDDHQGREEWFRSGRQAAGEHAADLLHRAYSQKQQMAVGATTSVDQSSTTRSLAVPGQNTANGIPFSGSTYPGNWTSVGPAPIASDPGQDYGKVVGRMTSAAVDQGDSSGNTVYIGAAFGGVWKSTNAAAADPTTVQWTPIIDDQPTLAVGAVTVQPGNSSIVLVGTGEPNSSGDSYYGMGVLRSADAGKTWTLIKTADNGAKTFAGLGASKFAWSTNASQPGLVVVGMGSTNGKRYGEDSVGGRGIYYSQDAGLTWHYATVKDSTSTTVTEGTVTDIAYNSATGRFYAFYRYHGFYESTDGVNWTRSAAQPQGTQALSIANCPTSQPNPNPTGTCPLYRGQIAIQPTTHDMYAIYVDQNDILQGVFVTSNGAASWTSLSTSGSSGHLADNTSTSEVKQGDYNLWIGAVPTAQGTDLMVGTRDILKCSLSSSDTTCAAGWKNLTFVYSCNPIAAPSHVHPDQHGFGFSIVNPQVMYFVNDGGVYRSLNGANGNGTCASANPFSNLDTNMGSVSEMVSFSQHPTNPNVLLGGLQDNGTPALLGTGVSLWQTVNGGDGGYNEIDPNNPDGIWYATNTRVSIQQCDATNKQAAPNGPGIPNAEACNPGAFGAAPYPSQGPNIGPTQVANDGSEFYTPYVLDPANTSNLIVGTCRLWRGPGVGGSSWLDPSSVANKDISLSFDGSALPCANGSTKVRAIAAGGPAPNGISQVLYVGLEGAGTLNDSGTNLGHVFVNTQADTNTGTYGAASGWTDVTANIAASLSTSGGTYGPYPISSIEIDRHDATGQTAYVTVEGFGVSHVFKTTNAGQSWSNLTSNLPDSPVDSIAVDPDDASTLYLGTDLGAFISVDAGATWQILGTGLPNVPVTKVRVFSSGGVKRLRVSTYGRGLWQFALPLPPSVSVSPSSLQQFSGSVQNPSQPQTVTVSNPGATGTSITAINFSSGFSESGGSCGVGTSLSAGTSCALPVVFIATTTGPTSGTLMLTDSSGATHRVTLSGNGSDFTVSAGSGGTSQTVTAGQSATYSLNISGINGFVGTVTAACSSGLPAGAACSFSPASVVVNGTVTSTVTLTISTTAHSGSQPAPTASSISSGFTNRRPGSSLAVVLAGLLSLWVVSDRRVIKGVRRPFAVLSVLGSVMFLPGCGGGASVSTTSSFASSNTPAGSYTVTVSSISGRRSIPLALTLKVN
ncbi:MAG TPA: hypothetical protein VM912_02940 [Terriglobales bacterium]|nr:hypothetical protein [Terriglobales bacterium]